MRLITYKIAGVDAIGCFFTENGGSKQDLLKDFPFLKATTLGLDLQVEIQKDQIKEDVPYLPFELVITDIHGSVVKTELEQLGGLITANKESEQRISDMLQANEKLVQEHNKKLQDNPIIEEVPNE